MKTKLPIFFSNPRSKSTALQTLAAPYMENSLGLLPLGHQTEFFNEYSHRYFFEDQHQEVSKRAEYFPLNRENQAISHHFVYPPVYTSKTQRDGHKIQVLRNEKAEGREYNIKIMSDNITLNQEKDHKWDRSILDFFADRAFVITRRRNVKTLAWSLLVSYHTNLWHKREANKGRYEDLYDNPITMNPELTLSVLESLKSTAMMDQFEDHIKKSGYESHTLYYEDLVTLEDMKDALDKVFDNKVWREYINDDFIQRSMPQQLNLDYKKIIKNYDEMEERIDWALKYVIG